MRLRLALHLDPVGPREGAPEARYAELLALVEAAEAAGLDAVWVAERPTQPDALLPAALPFCAAALARTQRLHLGTAVLPLPLHHPLRVAEDAATLDRLSEGRFELGVGLGSDADAAPAFGVPSAQRAARFDEAIALLQNAWREGAIERAGPTWKVEGVEVHPKPVTPGGPPLWVAAVAPAAQRRAGVAGVGLLLAPGTDASAYLEAYRQATHPEPPRVACLLSGLGDAAALGEKAAAFAEAGAGALDLVAPLSPGRSGPDTIRRFLELAGPLRGR